MDLKTQNWKNFIDQHLYAWHGIWTRYTPEGCVKESFRSLRHFKSNSDKTEIYQLNKYIYAEDNVEEESWTLNQSANSLSDGVFHPLAEVMRAYFFPSGHAIFAITQLKSEASLAIELFFKYQHLRHSSIIIYDDKGNLFRTVNIREDSTGYPSDYWSTELEQLSQRDLPQNCQGTSINLTPNLQISEPVTTQFNWSWAGNKTFFLPDGISLSCPEQVTIGTAFDCVVNWLINEREMHQLIAHYDVSGKFKSLTLQRYELK